MDKINLIKNTAVQIFSEEGLMERLKSGKTLKIKLGADPSRPDLHLGHSVVLRKLKLFQELGHEVYFVIGDFTGMIGDPSGKNKTRPQLTLEQTRSSGETYFKQVTKILDPTKTYITYNSQWLNKMSFQDIINLASKYTLSRIMERDDFKSRLSNNKPIGIHEILYPLIQGYDSVALNADIEVGGTDQTFNLLVGRYLQSSYGQIPQEVITFPLLEGLDGKEKMSKSLDNYIGIDEPANTIFEKCMKIPDELLLKYFTLTTESEKEIVEKLINDDIRNAHFEYARKIVTMYYDENTALEAEKSYIAVSKGSVPSSVPVFYSQNLESSICDLLKLVGFATSNSEARRHILGRGIKLDGNTIEDPSLQVTLNSPIVLKFGKNKFAKVIFKEYE